MRQTGTVKWFDAARGFGFIVPDGGGRDIFAHQSNIDSKGYRTLAEGEPVSFEIEDTERGQKAVMIRRGAIK